MLTIIKRSFTRSFDGLFANMPRANTWLSRYVRKYFLFKPIKYLANQIILMEPNSSLASSANLPSYRVVKYLVACAVHRSTRNFTREKRFEYRRVTQSRELFVQKMKRESKDSIFCFIRVFKRGYRVINREENCIP